MKLCYKLGSIIQIKNQNHQPNPDRFLRGNPWESINWIKMYGAREKALSECDVWNYLNISTGGNKMSFFQTLDKKGSI